MGTEFNSFASTITQREYSRSSKGPCALGSHRRRWNGVHTGSPAGLVSISGKDADSTQTKFDGIFLLGCCFLFTPFAVGISQVGHSAPEAVSVLAPTALAHDVAAVVVAQASAQLLVIHAGFPLALPPQPRHLGRRQGLV